MSTLQIFFNSRDKEEAVEGDENDQPAGLETELKDSPDTMTPKDRLETSKPLQYDRIFASRIKGNFHDTTDEIVESMARQLHPPNVNPKASIILHLTTATDTAHGIVGGVRHAAELARLQPHKWFVYTDRAEQEALEQGFSSTHELRKEKLADMREQEKDLFRTFVTDMGFKQAYLQAGLRLVPEGRMTVGSAWPYRLGMGGSLEEQEEQFQLRFSSKMKGTERIAQLQIPPDWQSSTVPAHGGATKAVGQSQGQDEAVDQKSSS